MSVSHFCIDRPIFASVISIVISLGGALAMLALPIAQYPDITPPQITVSATYPGANADVVANNVAAPIEQQVNGADNMIYMYSSSSSTGAYTLNAFFQIGTNPELAQVDVQNRVNLALPQLPSSVQSQGIQVQKKSSAFMMVIAIYSPSNRYDATYIANYANIYVLDALKRIPGANQSSIFGTPDYAMRIWLKPDRMAQLGITAADVQRAVANQNQQFAVGRIGQAPTGTPVEQSFAVTTTGRLTDPSEFENIIIRAANGSAAIVRLKDIGRAELGQKDYSIRSKFQGKPATVIAVYQQPGANALDVAKQVRATLAEMKKSFPEGIDYDIAMDTTEFTRASISDVIHTFFEALVLVVIVVFVFLQSLRATLIPVLAVPVSILGTFMGMLALGFSINMLTLFGMVLAIGIVVDDAIVVIENVERNMNVHKLSPKDAAKRAMDEVSGPVMAIVLVLCAVFVPVAFLGGITGQLYKQFAITIAISVVLSGVVALTLSPALAALLLKPGHHEKRGFFKWFDNAFARMTVGYTNWVKLAIKRFVVALLLFGGMIALAVVMLRAIPTSFLPPEDQGYLLGAIVMPDAASLDRTGDVSQHVTDYFMKQPAVSSVTVVDGFSLLDSQNKNNAGTFFVGFKSFDERYKFANIKTQNARAVLIDAYKALSDVKEGIILPVNPPSIPGLGTTGGTEVWIQAQGDATIAQLAQVVDDFIAKAKARPELTRVTSTFNGSAQQLLVNVDRDKSETLGVPIEDVYSAMQTMFGSLYVSQFNRSSRLWQVILQAEPSYRLSPQDLDQIYVRSKTDSMVPLKSVVTSKYVTGPDLITRFNNFPAVKITVNAAPGYSSGQVLSTLGEVGDEVLPAGYSLGWSGEAYESKQAGSTSGLVFVFGLIMVFLILAAQYEKWSLPFGVLMAVPFALFGALLAILLRGLENDVYFQIGLTMLVALAAKNAILIFEFAVLNRESGESVYDSAVTAAGERLRPIVMTSLAFILGCVPLAIATGASANSRHSIGTGVIGGMLGATVIAVFFIPMFFYLLETMSEKSGDKKTPGSSGGASGGSHAHGPDAGPGGPTVKPSARREDD
ncbi:Efflux pump membrane transporter BepE [Paraburkholderia domus]|jgi:The (Largely Gram-negative Bacterial) Hydrophobe/Amphiphile Efflux-1 (HAE1) Family|uniref:Efflux pump membrane transporter n=1 Tax=Paraburkholderia domus TaxID=2793075 RepID=A0A9N8MTD0_9BURK|nr:multidrug efflux RND transporter permease subunit [Paraburkholderia domus]MBK5049274.1 multidrug efflux RND transporter permease subunit [Burkholderia sp. R-70006]MBK5060243.1 multidrug efflux RND transporter permease subunit [Burkholderia sp. R-70199]MBK5085125.1 multidrug efflux RND transporter permease subunit [Burkholderia sp. R-69927]MBK5118507.1 multidrug efflux RND transporter permease subunit [Burkholderia sp. R-69980]MBK5164345.1 multidrug efflux RND transporter permease subunit [B